MMMVKQLASKRSDREGALRQRFPFATQSFESAAWSAITSVWGHPAEWPHHHAGYARRVLEVLADLTPETLSLREIKTRIAGQKTAYDLHRTLYVFLTKVKTEYHAEDEESFRTLVDLFENAGDSFSIVFNRNATSFDDIAYIDYYKRRNFYVVRAENPFLKALFCGCLKETQWTFDKKPNQKRLDALIMLVDQVVSKSFSVKSIDDMSLALFFELMDEINRRYNSGRVTLDVRRFLVKDTIHLFRYCLRLGAKMLPYGPICNPSILHHKSTVVFFLDEYISLDKTYNYVCWHSDSGKWGSPVTIDISNDTVRKAFGEFLGRGKEIRVGFGMCRNTLAKSLGAYADLIGTPGHPFSEETLLSQVNYYCEFFKGNHHRSEAITFIKQFYLFLDEQSNGGFFRKARTLSYKLLTSRRFERYCEEGYVFRRFSLYDKGIEGDRIVFFVSGLNRYRRNYLSEDYLVFDLSCIDNAFYQRIAWRAITSTIRRLYRKSFYYTLREILPFLSRLKSSSGYPTPQIEMITAWDVMFIIEYYNNKYSCDLTYNHNIREVRDFLHWARSTKVLEVDSAVFDYLKGKKIKRIPTNTPVLSDNEITLITEYFVKKSKSNSIYGQAVILTQLSLLTPLRIGHSCSLRLDELFYCGWLDTYTVVSSGKGTAGEKTEIVLGGRASDLIRKAVSIYKKNREECTEEGLNSYLFVYKFYTGSFTVFSSRTYGRLLSEACDALGLTHYTSRNLRATYMTKAYVEASENGYANEFVLKLFSYHRSMGTTLEHYVNHSDALAALTDHLKRGNDWQKMMYPDEIEALKDVIDKYKLLIQASEETSVKDQLCSELAHYETLLLKIQS